MHSSEAGMAPRHVLDSLSANVCDTASDLRGKIDEADLPRTTQIAHHDQAPQPPLFTHNPQHQLWNLLWLLLVIPLDFIKGVIQIMKRPIPFCLFLSIICVLLSVHTEYIWTGTLMKPCRSSWLSPVIPAIMCLAGAIPSTSEEFGCDVDFEALTNITTTFLAMALTESGNGSASSLTFKRSEMATDDLIIRVTESFLPHSTHIVEHLENFRDQLASIAEDLVMVDFYLRGSVEHLLITSEWIAGELEKRIFLAPKLGEFTTMLLNYTPWPAIVTNREKRIRKEVEELWLTMVTESYEALKDVDMQVTALNAGLAKLNLALKSIRTFLDNATSTVAGENDRVLGALWSMLGFKAEKLAAFTSHRKILDVIDVLQKRAQASMGTVQILFDRWNATVTYLRQQVSTSLMSNGAIPIEVHARHVRKGIERLMDMRRCSNLRAEEMRRALIRGGGRVGIDGYEDS